MDFTYFVVQEDDSQRRVDRVAKRILECHNSSQTASIPQLFRKGLIKLNGKKTEISTRTQKDDQISIASFLLENSIPQVQKNPLPQDSSSLSLPETVFQNRFILVLNKPYGISSQPSEGASQDLSTAVQRNWSGNGSLSFRPGALHRLDRYTTGLIAFSQNLEGARWFSQNISTHVIRKTYVAVVEGKLQESHWTDYISDDSSHQSQNNRFQTVKVTAGSIQDSKEAITHAFPLATGNFHGKNITLAQFNIETGRKHQIRSQSSFHGHPLLGDTAYGGTQLENHQYYLHAMRLTFPKDNPLELPEHIIAKIPEDLSNFLKINLINWDGESII